MSKRFTGTEKWDDPWFFELSNENKLLWIYLLDKCNHAGIFQFNQKMTEFILNNKYDWDEIKNIFNSRIVYLTKDKWFIQKFVDFQYGELNPENRAHNSVISILKKEGAYKGLIRSLEGRKDKDKDKALNKHSIYYLDILPKELTKFSDFVVVWKRWVNFRVEIKKKMPKTTVKSQINFLIKQPDPIGCIEQSIMNGWQGLFKLNDKREKKVAEELPMIDVSEESPEQWEDG